MIFGIIIIIGTLLIILAILLLTATDTSLIQTVPIFFPGLLLLLLGINGLLRFAIEEKKS